MNKTFFTAILFLLCLDLMVSCVEKSENKVAEKQKQQTLQARETVLEERDDTISCVYAYAIDGGEIDTLIYKDYIFFSQPIPNEVQARMQGKSMPDNAAISYDELRYLLLYYYDYDGKVKQGEMVCNHAIAHDLLCIFRDLFKEAYLINSIRLVDDFDASDEASMEANNTSCFNYRTVVGTRMLSMHAFGLAVDVNPLQNPCIRGGRAYPTTAKDYIDRTKDFSHKIDKNDFCKEVFTSYGFKWGGSWGSSKDYQHFEKRTKRFPTLVKNAIDSIPLRQNSIYEQ